MNRDRIERALREPGPRERGYVPEPLPATAAELRARRTRRRGVLMSAGALGGLAAAVAAGAVVAIVLTRGFGPGPATTGAGSSPTSTSTPLPTASAAPVSACRAGDFAWSSDPWGGAAGSRGTTILARGVASLGSCELKGEATLLLRDANGNLLVSGKSAATKVTVAGGQAFQLGVAWSNWCQADPGQPISLSMTLPGDTLPIPLIPPTGSEIQVPPCNGPGLPSVLSATDFQPSDRSPQG